MPGVSTAIETLSWKRRERLQRRQQLLRIMLDRPHAGTAEDRRERASHHLAVGEHVGDARRHAQIVFEHDERAVFAPHDVRSADVDIGVERHRQAAHLAPVMLRAVDQIARHEAVVQDPPVVVDVLQEKIERRDALLQACFEPVPFRGRDDARQKIGRDDSFGRLIVAVDREGDALMQERLLARLLPQAEFFGRQFGEAAMQLCVVRPHASVGGEHLVIRASEAIMRVGAFLARLGISPTSGLQGYYRSCESFLLHVRNENVSSIVPSSGFVTRPCLAAGVGMLSN